MLYLIPVITSGYGRYFSHYIPNHLFEETHDVTEFVKLPNVSS